MQRATPFYESPEDALRAAIQALGGSKKMGAMLWPDKTIENASRLLMDCINPGRPEKLDLSQVMWVFTQSKNLGFHDPFAWFSDEIGYDVKPIPKEEEMDRVTSVVEQAAKTLAAAIEKLDGMRTRQSPRLHSVGKQQ